MSTVAPAVGLLPLPPAEQSLQAAVARQPRDPDAHRALARYLLDQHRPFAALWQFRLARDLQPADPNTARGLARALCQASFPARARALLQARLAAAPADLETRRTLAETALAVAQPGTALASLRGAGAALAASAPAELLLGDACFADGDRGGAQVAYQRVVVLEPEGATGYDRLGRLALGAGEWRAAQAAEAAAREREPGTVSYGCRLGQAYWGLGQRTEAEQLWEELAAAAPRYGPVQLALGQAYRQRRQWDQAAPYLVAAVNDNAASEEAQFALAAVMMAQGDRASAAYQRGLYYLQTDRPHLALAEFRRMIALAPERVDGPLMTSLACMQMKRLDLAAVEAQRGLARHPHDPRLLERLGMVHVLGFNWSLAQQLGEEWLKAEPQAAGPYRLLGRVARGKLRRSEAVRCYEAALARDPKNAIICSEMARVLSGLPGPENARRALDLARQAAVLTPNETDYWQQWGVLLRGAGQPEEAAAAQVRALDLNPASAAACSALVEIAAREGRTDSSRFYASLATELQDRRRAGDRLWRAVYSQPEDAAAHARLAQFLIETGDLRRADYQLRQVAALRPGDRAAQGQLAVVERLLALRAD